MKLSNFFCGGIITLLFSCIISCTNKPQLVDAKAQIFNDTIETTSKLVETEEESDCVFDNKPKELTSEWLKQSGFDNFKWDYKKKNAIVISNGDTLFVYKGGCNHLTNSVEIRTSDQYDNLLDEKLLQKINDIACKFKFKNYCSKLIIKQFEKTENGSQSVRLEFEDENPDDNLILDGITITKQNKALQIIISEYYN